MGVCSISGEPDVREGGGIISTMEKIHGQRAEEAAA